MPAARNGREFGSSSGISGSRLFPHRSDACMTQEEFSQSMAMAKLIFLSRLASPYQIAQRLVVGIRNPHRRQLAGPVTPCQLLGVPAVSLHPISGLGGDQRRRDHFTRHTQLHELPVENVSRWPGLITALQRLDRRQLTDHLPNRLQPVRDDSQAADFPTGFSYRHGDRVGMDIQPYKA